MKSIPTVKYDTSYLTADVLARLKADVRSIHGVTAENFDDLYEVILRAIAKGGDLATLSVGLQERVANMTLDRSASLSRRLWFRTKMRSDINRKLALGITEAIWQYANAPCFDPSNQSDEDIPRDKHHKAASGKRFKIENGLTINGELTWPGLELGCKCSMRSVIVGFE